jgi:GNAT superfamily N-acetyltransferase
MDFVVFDRADAHTLVADYLRKLDEEVTRDLDFGVIAFAGDEGLGHILLKVRPITPMFVGELDLLDFKGEDTAKAIIEERREAFVLTFEVRPDHRRKGIGTKLQLAAIEACRRKGMYQIRGWSSYNKAETYRLKLRLGFAAVPGVQYIERIGKWVPGTYFVMPLNRTAPPS